MPYLPRIFALPLAFLGCHSTQLALLNGIPFVRIGAAIAEEFEFLLVEVFQAGVANISGQGASIVLRHAPLLLPPAGTFELTLLVHNQGWLNSQVTPRCRERRSQVQRVSSSSSRRLHVAFRCVQTASDSLRCPQTVPLSRLEEPLGIIPPSDYPSPSPQSLPLDLSALQAAINDAYSKVFVQLMAMQTKIDSNHKHAAMTQTFRIGWATAGSASLDSKMAIASEDDFQVVLD
ncbi:hypothetical protein BKA83DRAFT_4127538 [Pisolithus microcarpus]|nr:hypothetical protein BKA83DRAFT_4127538 [Pisolithus microcarpus]